MLYDPFQEADDVAASRPRCLHREGNHAVRIVCVVVRSRPAPIAPLCAVSPSGINLAQTTQPAPTSLAGRGRFAKRPGVSVFMPNADVPEETENMR